MLKVEYEIHTSIPINSGQHLTVLLRPEDIVITELDENEQSKQLLGMF